MSTEDYEALELRTLEGWNEGDLAAFDEVIAPDYLYHDPDAPTIRTREDYKRWVIEVRRAFPDFHLTGEDMIVAGDKVVTRWTWRGTNTGELVGPTMRLPATGKQVTVTGMSIDRFAGGKIVESWQQGDTLGMFQQLGLIPVTA